MWCCYVELKDRRLLEVNEIGVDSHNGYICALHVIVIGLYVYVIFS